MMMKNGITIILLLLLGVQPIIAQVNWGVKGGLNFNSNGKIYDEIGEIAEKSSSASGYHFGLFIKTKATKLFIKPELVFTHTNSEYDDLEFSMNKIDLPINVGLTIIKPISIFAGPSIQYIINQELDGVTLGDVENDLTVGGNIGVAAQLGRIWLDIRYERGFSKNEAEFLNIENQFSIDTRPEQLILSLSIQI